MLFNLLEILFCSDVVEASRVGTALSNGVDRKGVDTNGVGFLFVSLGCLVSGLLRVGDEFRVSFGFADGVLKDAQKLLKTSANGDLRLGLLGESNSFSLNGGSDEFGMLKLNGDYSILSFQIYHH
eukprot:NODE_107_length_19843_cov_0.502077.p14 type:complete len:125 gc:universal NODE_107_length_19843_cov_0.502077:2132-1758(-)